MGLLPFDRPKQRNRPRATWEHTYHDTIPENIRSEFLSRAYSDESLQRRIYSSAFLVAVCDDEVVGFSDWDPTSETEVVLAAIYVLPHMQGRGIGSRLLLTGLERFSSARKFVLRVERDNTNARRFYEAHGFHVSREIVEHLAGHRVHELEMVLEIGRSGRREPPDERFVGTP
jgi:ribosomal protein S18 acetylase RimI-like enzyme